MLYLDDRVGSKELKTVVNVPCELTRLEFADACFIGNGPDDLPWGVGIERKTITDLLGSITSGRLVGHQMIGMLNAYKVIYLVVEGAWRIGPKTGLLELYRGKRWTPAGWHSQRFTGKGIVNFLNDLAVECGIHLWISQNKTQTGLWLSALYNWWQKPWEQHKALNMFHTLPQPPVARLQKPGIVACVAKEFKGVGWERAHIIEKRFASVQEFALTQEHELEELEGIGKVMAKSIVREINGV